MINWSWSLLRNWEALYTDFVAYLCIPVFATSGTESIDIWIKVQQTMAAFLYCLINFLLFHKFQTIFQCFFLEFPFKALVTGIWVGQQDPQCWKSAQIYLPKTTHTHPFILNLMSWLCFSLLVHLSDQLRSFLWCYAKFFSLPPRFSF